MPDNASRYTTQARVGKKRCLVATIWIDWYAYHVARFIGIDAAPSLSGKVYGIELVSGVGVHAGLKFREDIPLDVPIETLMPEKSWQQAGQFRLATKLWRHLSKLRPEVLLVPGYYTLPALAAAIWAKVHHTTSVLMTESTMEDHRRFWWKEIVKSLVIRAFFDWAVAGGKAHVRYLQRLHFPADRIAHFYDVVDNDFFEQATDTLRKRSAEEFGLPGHYFLYVGRLAPEKNIEWLITSWIVYREAGGTWPLVLVGDGPLASSLQAGLRTSPFGEDVHFAGHQTSAALPTFYAFASCFVLPSTREPWGLVVNEAMASGVPVLVSNRCGCAEDLVSPGHNGLLFDPSHPLDLTENLRWIENAGKEALGAMAFYARENIRQYSPKAFGCEIARIQSLSSSPEVLPKNVPETIS